MQKDIIIRQAEYNDSHEIVGMQRALAEYCAYPAEDFAINEQIVAGTIEYDSQSKYFVGETSEQLIGMMLCHRIPLGWRGVSGVYVEDLYVKPDYRHGLGVGRLLLGRACELAVQYAAGRPESAFVRLDTGIKDNEDTLCFYRKLGMSEDNLNFRLYGRAVTEMKS